MTTITGESIVLRGFRDSDVPQLTLLCNNRNIWDNLRDYIPYPYTEKDAVQFIGVCTSEAPQCTFAVEYNNILAGSIGLVLQKDVYRLSAETGYWIGEPFWGKGLATQAVQLIANYGFEELNLARIFTGVFGFNRASQRVLEKAGFLMEGISRNAVYKNGVLCDEYRYSKLNTSFTIPSDCPTP